MATKKSSSSNSGKCFVSPWNSIVLILLVLLTIWFFYYLLTMTYKKSAVETFLDIEKYEDKNKTNDCKNTKKPYSLLFFYMDTCPHCIEFKPTWKKFTHSFENKKENEKVCIGEVSADKEDISSKYNVHSFPTVLLVSKSGQTTPFEGSRTIHELMNFVTQNVS